MIFVIPAVNELTPIAELDNEPMYPVPAESDDIVSVPNEPIGAVKLPIFAIPVEIKFVEIVDSFA